MVEKNQIKRAFLLSSQGNSVADNAPIGTIWPYVGDIANIPPKWHLCDGTDGTPNLLDGRFLEGNTTIRIFKEPGLPNITGSTNNAYFQREGENTSSRGIGAIRTFGSIRNIWSDGRNTVAFQGIQFNASWSSSIYGASDTVQPRSYTVYFIMKMK